jgi:DNA-binding CsgD family transcriptional regulator
MPRESLVIEKSEISLNASNLLEQMPCAIGIKNQDSIYVAANYQVAELTGFSHGKQMIGIQDKDLHCAASELHETFIKQDQEAIAKQKIVNLDICQYSNNQLRAFLSVKTQLIDDNNKSFVLFTMTEFPILAIGQLMTEISQSSSPNWNNISASYRIQNPSLIQENVSDIALSKRLSEVLFLVLKGQSIKTIGHKLGISPKTAEEHINRLKKIFGCYSKSQLIEKAFVLGYANIIPPSLLKLS